jgi:hypothetical protein
MTGAPVCLDTVLWGQGHMHARAAARRPRDTLRTGLKGQHVAVNVHALAVALHRHLLDVRRQLGQRLWCVCCVCVRVEWGVWEGGGGVSTDRAGHEAGVWAQVGRAASRPTA